MEKYHQTHEWVRNYLIEYHLYLENYKMLKARRRWTWLTKYHSTSSFFLQGTLKRKSQSLMEVDRDPRQLAILNHERAKRRIVYDITTWQQINWPQIQIQPILFKVKYNIIQSWHCNYATIYKSFKEINSVSSIHDNSTWRYRSGGWVAEL